MYKLGLILYGFVFSNTRVYYVLCYTDTGFRIFSVSRDIIPESYHHQRGYYRELSTPVLCQTTDRKVVGLRFLPDFPISSTPLDEAFSFYVENEKATLMYKGYHIKKALNLDKRGEIFLNLLTQYTVATKIIADSNTALKYISAQDEFYMRKRNISQLVKYIDSINLNHILESLYVEVHDHYRYKSGDDDHYNIYRTARLADSSIEYDSYIKHIIGIGENVRIYESSAYGGSLWGDAEDFRKTHPLGIYSDEMLETEKQRIISSYSREEHMAFLFYENLDKQYAASSNKAIWEEQLKYCVDQLNEQFNITKLINIDQRLYTAHQYDKDDSGLLDSLNSYIHRSQRALPLLNIVISGNVPKPQDRRRGKLSVVDSDTNKDLCYEKIKRIVEDLSDCYQINIITGGANGAESLALHFAMNYGYDFTYNPINWTSLSREYKIDRAYEMAQLADIIFLTGDNEHYLNRNLIQAANELNKTIRFFNLTD